MSPSRRFENRSALVTGASSGIGRACARALAAEGARVVLAGRRKDRLESEAAAIRGQGGSAEIVTGDVREESTCAAFVERARSAFGGLDALVNAAGVIGSGGVLETDAGEWDRVMDSNLRSIHLMTRAAAPLLIERKGAIVNLSSVAAPRPYAGLLAYCVSKAAVDQYTRCVALDLAPRGVRVNAVNPGVVVTELHTVSHAVPDYPAFLERSKTTHPLGRVGQPEEVAALILFLLSDEAGWITGATYAIDGGRALASAR
ncbi:MAG TPA: glucose 1-dehydrogenase [Candidatus Udaeobacter sp.]|jgi:NAD(P)-dependent dehydrogenase (short-subunit alcohol dehydrogenase family)|nr:glucose 1-dehydrogenase [Candidatus Udaeobacter sp.]